MASADAIVQGYGILCGINVVLWAKHNTYSIAIFMQGYCGIIMYYTYIYCDRLVTPAFIMSALGTNRLDNCYLLSKQPANDIRIAIAIHLIVFTQAVRLFSWVRCYRPRI